MTLQTMEQLPLTLPNAGKRDVRTQFAALCYRISKKKPEVLLITSRESGRWIVPKGWPMEGKTPAECAMIEAWEEAGVRGEVTGGCLGLFSYYKSIERNGLPCVAMVYPVLVTNLEDKFPEAGQRRRKWFRLKKASDKVDEAELAHLLRNFDPRAQMG